MKFDLSVFNGTAYEGMSLKEIRESMTPQQRARFQVLHKREIASRGYRRADDALTASYRGRKS